jgi:hypothetical protein
VFPKFGGVECQDDVLFGNTSLDELVGDQAVGVIALNPNLSADNVDVDDRMVNPLPLVPAYAEEFVAVSLPVNERFGLDLTVGGLVGGVFANQVFDRPAIAT